MAGASGSGEEMQTGRTNRAEDRTRIWAQVQPGQASFNGPAMLIVETALDAEDPDDYEDLETFTPSNPVHGIMTTAWSGAGSAMAPTVGVIAKGGRRFGTGVLGLGGGVPEPGSNGEGGIGVHGLGGSKADFFADPSIAPGPGLVGQGGRQSPTDNRARMPHAAGVIGIAGGTGKGVDLLPLHPPSETGGVGVYGKGADVEVQMVSPVDATGSSVPGPQVPSGPPVAGPGVIGRGGTTATGAGFQGAGVIGLAGGMAIPGIAATGDVGVAGLGRIGLSGTGAGDRACVLQTDGQPQLHLVPLRIDSPLDLKEPGRAGDLLCTLRRDERGTEIASLWFCAVGGPPSSANWVKIA